MKRFPILLSVLFQVFVLSSFPVLAGPADLLTGGLDATNNAAGGGPGYNTSLSLPVLIGRMIGVLLGIIGIAFVVYLVIAGIIYMTASGDDTKVKKAKAMIRDSVIGIIIMISAYAVSSFVISQLVAAAK